MFFDMHLSMILSLAKGALTFYYYPKAFGDPELAWEHRNLAYQTSKVG